MQVPSIRPMRSHHAKPISKTFAFHLLKVFVPAALLIIAFSIFVIHNERNKEFVAHSVSEQAVAALGKGSIMHLLEYVKSDLQFIANDPMLGRFLDGAGPAALGDVSENMLAFAASHPVYDHIRWIDETGRERVRINGNSGNGGRPGIVPDEQLQDKLGRYYFNAAMQLQPGEIYVSPFDLNVENGKIETPYKPVLRVATPVADSRGRKRGIVVLNYLGDRLISRFNTSAASASGRAMLLNQDGYWLKGAKREQEWGFMLSRAGLTLATTHPSAWQRISTAAEGQFRDADGLWTFSTLQPFGNDPAKDGITGVKKDEVKGGIKPAGSQPDEKAMPGEQWKIVLHLPTEQLFAATDSLIMYICGGATLLLGLLFAGSWAYARSRLRKLAETDLRIAATVFQSQQGFLVTDANRSILRVNRAFTAITGYDPHEVLGKNPRIFSSGRQDESFYKGMWDRLNRAGAWEGEIWNRRKNGEIYPLSLSITAVRDGDGKITNYVASQVDITRRKTAEEEIQYLAFYDHLTALPNRRLLLDRLQRALVCAARNRRSGALLFIDLDNFKTLNDTLGHDMGDLLLKQVAQRLSGCVRKEDTVARLGGDEFVVMLEKLSMEGVEAAAEAEAVASKILASFMPPFDLGSHEHRCSPSIGIAQFTGEEQGVEDVLKQADIAMYHAKKSGRNTVRFFDPKMQENINARVAMEAAMDRALEESQFEPYYQLQVAHDGHAVGAEVLIRWHHPERGLLMPKDFIPLAEETGTIVRIGDWLLDATCRQLKAWEENYQTRELGLSVNVSARQFRQPGFICRIEELIRCHAINPARLKLELTESVLLEEVEEAIRSMQALRDIGVQFSLDDFGTGYSSLRYIKDLPLSQLKIDESFVRGIASDRSDQIIVSTVVAMARSLNLNVIAEGVETEEQRHFLLLNGCTHFQGYLFGRPVPLEKFEAELMRTHKASAGAASHALVSQH